MNPHLSDHFKSRSPSAIRLAQIKFMKRNDKVQAINVAIGNVSLPMHPAMQKRMFTLNSTESPFKNGVVKYSATVGFEETNNAFLHIVSAMGVDTSSLYSQVTDGGSHAMELVTVGVGGNPGVDEKPLLVIDPAYTNYISMAERTGRKIISIARTIGNDGTFLLPRQEELEAVIAKHNPAAIIVIPYDNPTGQFYSMGDLNLLAEIAVKHNLWLISDEAYRELYYGNDEISSIWKLTESDVPGISGRRISIETASKIWNACGLRIGAIVTDNKKFHEKCVAENTANLCANVIGQYIFGALLHESHDSLKSWYEQQRSYYRAIAQELQSGFQTVLPNVIISNPDAAIYTIVDVKKIVDDQFDAQSFCTFCAEKGSVDINGELFTLLISPMNGFYTESSQGRTQMRIAFVEEKEKMMIVPELFTKLLEQFLDKGSE